jgi:hypothetical protein
MGKQVSAICQDVQAFGNQMGTMNQGIKDLSNCHNTLHKQCETKFEKEYNDCGNMTMTFGKVNNTCNGMSTHVQVIWTILLTSQGTAGTA